MPEAGRDVSTVVAFAGVADTSWEAAIKARAQELYAVVGDAGRVARILAWEAQRDAGDGEALPAVPSARTIRHWAHVEEWERRSWAAYAAEHEARLLRLGILARGVAESALLDIIDCQHGLHDGDPKRRDIIQRGAVAALAAVGFSAAAGNHGGALFASPGAVSRALGDAEEAPADEDARLRRAEAMTLDRKATR